MVELISMGGVQTSCPLSTPLWPVYLVIIEIIFRLFDNFLMHMLTVFAVYLSISCCVCKKSKSQVPRIIIYHITNYSFI